MRFVARTDANQREIVRALRDVGASVYPTHMVGRGYPDLSVGFRGMNYYLEVKSDSGLLTPDETTFFNSWRGQVCVVRSVEEAMKAIGAI